MTSKFTYKVCCCFRRIFRLEASEPPEDVKMIFSRYSENGIMTVDQLQSFLIEYQGEKNASKEDAHKIMEDLKDLFKHPHKYKQLRKGELHIEAFFRYLLSDSNPPLLNKVHHDMNAPMSHYFIYTGHNSYLTGNQLSSDSSEVPIIEALHNSVRVIELDLWPNASKDNIDVLHGWTLTRQVELIKCLRAIKDHAFAKSPYPVIITLEDHLTPNLQTKVAEMITQTFGKMLFIPGKEKSTEFHSPESLKNRILISTKPPKEHEESNENKKKETGTARNIKIEYSWEEEVLGFEGDMKIDRNDKIQNTEALEYKSLIAIHGEKAKGEMNDILRVHPDKVCRLSISEEKLQKTAQTHSTHMVRFTQKNFLRVYPKGSRINSSNYNPLMGWLHGAQMVALNMQGYGRSLWLMHGMFKANGGCGYVKKPDFLLKHGGPYDRIFHFRENLPVKKTLKVKVYMGEGWHLDFHHTHFDLCSPPDFYTRIGIAGVRKDSVMKQTKMIEDDWTPDWDEEFLFPLTVPELALLQIEVNEFDPTGNDDFGGQTCLPVSEIRTGIRAVPLYNHKGEKYRSVKLLIRFEFI